MAEKRDYYEVLGLNKNATDDEIKSAYKKLVKQWHPDKFANEPEDKKKEAEERMKEINVAYEVLKDPKKREQYDQFGHSAPFGNAGGAGGAGFDPNDIFGGGGFGGGGIFGDIFDTFFGGSRRQSERGPSRGSDLRYDLNINFEDAAFGKDLNIKVPRQETCSECHGTGAAKGTNPETCPDCHGVGQRQTVTRTAFGQFASLRPCERCHGTGKIIKTPCPKCKGEGKVSVNRDIKLHIPRGVDNGTRLRVQGGGQAGNRGGQPGDLYVYIRIKPHAIFTREGSDVQCEIPISFVQAALGAKVDAPTIDGKIELTIPAGTQSGTILRIKGKGIPHLRGDGRGDEHVKIKVLTPQNLTERQKTLLRQFESGVDDDKVHPEKKSFIDKLKSFFN